MRTKTHVKGADEHEGYVYVFKLWIDDWHKIGVARDWRQRLRALQAGNPVMTVVMAFPFRNPHKLEKKLHKKYKDMKVEREIFSLDIEMLENICNYLFDMSIAGGIISKGLEGRKGICRWEWKTNTEGVVVDVGDEFPELDFIRAAPGGTR